MQLLRMIGTNKVEVLTKQKEVLFEFSLRYAKFDKPDFILLKESILAYERIIYHQQQISKNIDPSAAVNEGDKKHIFNLLNVVINTFGTEDTEWFCAADTILNTLFNIKTRNSPEYARHFIQSLTRKLYSTDSKKRISQLPQQS